MFSIVTVTSFASEGPWWLRPPVKIFTNLGKDCWPLKKFVWLGIGNICLNQICNLHFTVKGYGRPSFDRHLFKERNEYYSKRVALHLGQPIVYYTSLQVRRPLINACVAVVTKMFEEYIPKDS